MESGNLASTNANFSLTQQGQGIPNNIEGMPDDDVA